MSSPRVSVFTPSHLPTYLDDCYGSLLAQTYSDWEWIVVLNGNNTWAPTTEDPRVKLINGTDIKGVGALKRKACEESQGEFLVELDHDDKLTSNALEEIVNAFDAHSECGFVYSDCAHITAGGDRHEHRYNPAMGW